MFESLINYLIQTYGYLGLFILMIFQTIFVIIPSEAVVTLSGALGLDITKIIIVGTLGLIAGAVIAFYISRYFGRKIVIKIIGKEWVAEVDEWISEYGFKAIMVARLVPLVPFDLISYVAGLTSIDFKKYMIATVIGMIPRVIFLVFIGNTAKTVLSLIGIGIDLIIVVGLSGIILIIYLDRKGYLRFLRNKILKKVVKTKTK